MAESSSRSIVGFRVLNDVIIRHHVEQIPEPEQRRQVSSYVQLMAGLKYDKEVVRRLFSEGIMRESVIHQEIFQAGEVQGEARGEAQGERRMVVRILSRKLGDLSPFFISQLNELSLGKIEALGDAMVDFMSIEDLTQWLEKARVN